MPVKTTVIPVVGTPEFENFKGEVFGTLQDGAFCCLECVPIEGEHPVKVYGINLSPYSAVCKKCGTLVVDGIKKADGSGPLCLFD